MSENKVLVGEPQGEIDLNSLDEEEKMIIASENFKGATLDDFKKNTIQSKEELLARMKQARVRFQQEAASGEKKHSDAFYEILDGLYDRALSELICMEFPEPLRDWWFFLYEITANGLTVRLNHIEWHDFSCSRKESFVLLEVPVKLLTVTEYAKRYGVGPTTVRSWIRRAKIRSAVKCGSEWRIPELAEVREERSYIPCQYVWRSTLTDVPEKYAYLKEFAGMDLWKEYKEYGKTIYLGRPRLQEEESRGPDWPELAEKRRKILSKYKGVSATEDGLLVLNADERAALELYLISSPLVQFRKDGDFKFRYQIIEEGGEFCEGSVTFFAEVEDWLY